MNFPDQLKPRVALDKGIKHIWPRCQIQTRGFPQAARPETSTATVPRAAGSAEPLAPGTALSGRYSGDLSRAPLHGHPHASQVNPLAKAVTPVGRPSPAPTSWLPQPPGHLLSPQIEFLPRHSDAPPGAHGRWGVRDLCNRPIALCFSAVKNQVKAKTWCFRCNKGWLGPTEVEQHCTSKTRPPATV